MEKKIKEVQAIINEKISCFFLDFGFTYMKSDFEYIKKTKKVAYIYRINVQKMTEWYRVETEVYLGASEVIRMFNQALGRKLSSGNPICGFGIRNRYGDTGNYAIDSEDDIDNAVDGIRSDFECIALPFFREHDSLGDIDLSVNEKKTLGTPTVSAACKWIIVAKLCDNPRFDELAKEYYDFNKEPREALAEPILRMKRFLDHL